MWLWVVASATRQVRSFAGPELEFHNSLAGLLNDKQSRVPVTLRLHVRLMGSLPPCRRSKFAVPARASAFYRGAVPLGPDPQSIDPLNP